MSTTSNEFSNIGTSEFLNDIDSFVYTTKKREKDVLPAVIQIPVFQSRRLLARIINKLSALPLRLIRRSTTHFWYTQKQTNYELRGEVDTLNAKVSQLRKELNDIRGSLK